MMPSRLSSGLYAFLAFTMVTGYAAPAAAQRDNLLPNGSVEDGVYPDGPFGWQRQAFGPGASLTWDIEFAHDGAHSVKVIASQSNDAGWIQTIAVAPNTNYLLWGWIKTDNVAHTNGYVDAGANLCLFGTWQRTAAVIGTADWTQVGMVFNSGPTGTVTIGARLGYWSGTTTGTAWFDDMRFAEIKATDPHPAWKLLVLVYDTTDFTYADQSVTRHVIGHIDPAQVAAAASAASRFVLQDIPALTSGHMVPSVTIRYPGPLTRLSPHGGGWWPSPTDTANDADPAFDSVIVIWQPTVVDQTTGERLWIGSAAGLTPPMGTGQAYTTLIIEAATMYGHLNVFKHEWGHSILSYFDALGTAPRPTVTNHTDGMTYVNCRTGAYYVWQDETDDNPIPNSIYNNDSGFTHDYYSGTTALATDPTSCLGITSSAWATGGPVSKPEFTLDNTPPTSRVVELPATQSSGSFTVQWTGSDVGAGIQDFTIYVSDDGSAFAPFMTGTSATSAVFTGQHGHSYAFYSIARDFVGNVEGTKTLAEATTRVDIAKPVISGMPAPDCRLWPPNHKLRQVATVTASGVGATLASFSVTGASNEPADPGPDIVITGTGLGSRGVQLRAERFGWGSGRTYTLTATATDTEGNTTTATGTCIVPHDQR